MRFILTRLRARPPGDRGEVKKCALPPDIVPFSWIKNQNPEYTQARERAELFQR